MVPDTPSAIGAHTVTLDATAGGRTSSFCGEFDVQMDRAEFAERVFEPFHGRFAVKLRSFIFGVSSSEIFGAEVIGQADFHDAEAVERVMNNALQGVREVGHSGEAKGRASTLQ